MNWIAVAKWAIWQAFGKKPGTKGDRIVRLLDMYIFPAVDLAMQGHSTSSVALMDGASNEVMRIAEVYTNHGA